MQRTPIIARAATGLLLGAAALLAVLPDAARAAWPDKPVTLIVPSAAGGAADLTARTFAQFLGARTGQSIVVEDRAGAGGIVGTHAAKIAPHDGYTFLLSTNSTHSANQFLYKSLPYDAQQDFRQVGMFGTFGTVAIARPDAPYKTVPELVQYAQAHPGKVFFGYYSSSSQVPPELFKARAGIKIDGAAYKNITQIITDLRGGQIDFAFVDYLTAMGQIDGKSLRPLAVTGAQRHPSWPDVPTMDSYYPGYVVEGWLGLSAPAGTPEDIVQAMNGYMAQALQDKATADKLRALGLMPKSMDVPRFDAFVKADTQRWKEWVDVAGIQPQ
ncbi:Bug family tripartite tricarboxylate transporter substrate binding protein [Achromobacter aloeverae]|uniref:Tripartite tricarboxylate transporter substrate binding protein n=1 Tax=Achromobacter aloeverae TaxID=1750518 RepID=A0A4Q1HL86_9BURK|nr:tripartite tricarboxylate transporter substrate binding protein [Achromobacter aloeverae]RXN91006.1 tripartite tricarboxylate transporter substrate binding protein [Achromobacter aloeverae]